MLRVPREPRGPRPRTLPAALLLALAASASTARASDPASAAPLAGWQDLVRTQIARHLEGMWGAPVTFRDVEFKLAPPTLTLGRLECSTRLWGWRSALRIERLSASPVLWSLVRGSVEWEKIEIDGLEIEASLEPSPGAAPASVPAGQPLSARSLRVSRSTLTLRAGPGRVRASLALEGATRSADGALAGSVRAESVVLEGLEGLESSLRFQGEGAWAWAASGLEVSPLGLRGEAGSIALHARLAPEASRADVEATLDPSRLRLPLPAGLTLAGEWKASGTWSRGRGPWEASGSVGGGEAAWEDLPLGKGLSAHWKATPDGVEISDLDLSLLGGTLRVRAALPAPAYDRIRAEVRAYGVPASAAGRLWPGLPALTGAVAGDAEVEIPLGAPPGALAASGTLRLIPAADARWPLALEARFSKRAESLEASGRWRLHPLGGTIEARGGRARLTLEEAPLSRVLRLARDWVPGGVAEALLAVEGTVSGEGDLDLADARHPWSASVPIRALSMGERALGELELRAVGDDARWSGEAVLSGGSGAAGTQPDPRPRLHGEALLRWEMEPMRAATWAGDLLADVSLPVAGGARLRLSGKLGASRDSRLGATLEAPALQTTAHLHAERDGDSSWTGWIRADDGAEGWADVRLRGDLRGGIAAAAGQIGRWRTRRGPAEGLAPGLLADLLEASIGWSAGAPGPLARLSLLDQNADGTLEKWGEGRLDWQEGSLHLTLTRESPPLRLQARIAPGGAWPYRVEGVAPTSQVEVTAAARLLTVFGGSVVLAGTLRPWSWEASVDLERFALLSAGHEWLASGPVRGSGSPAGWRLDPIRLEGEAGTLEVQVDPASGGVHARGDLSAAPLGRWLGEAEVAGRVRADLLWSPGGGSRGSLALEGFRLASGLFPFPVDDLGGSVALEADRLRIEDLQGKAGSGTFTLRGDVPLPGSQRPWSLALAARGVPIRQPPGLSGLGDLDLRLEGPASFPRIEGEARLGQGVYTLPEEMLRVGGAGMTLEFGDFLPPAARALRVEVSLRSEQLWLRSEYTRLECRGAVEVSGTLARPALRGQLAAVEGGEVRFNDVRYRVVSGLMEFTGGTRLDPRVDLQAETERGDYLVHLEVRGTLGDLRAGLRSDPPLPTPEIVRLLTTGRVGEETTGVPGGQAGGLAGGLVGSVVGGRVLAPLESGLQSFLPVDTLDIDPLAVSGQGDPTARITLGKRLSRRVTLSYSGNLAGSQEDLYQLRYRLQPGIELIASREDDGSIGGDLRYSRRLYPGRARPPDAEEEARPTARRVRFHGDSPFSRRRLRSAITLVPGERASTYDLFDSRERLWRLHARAGYPQAVVEATLRPRRRGAADAVFEIEAGARLSVRLEGAELPGALGEQILELWRDPDLRALVAVRAEQRIAEYFRAQGYPAASARFAGSARDGETEAWTFAVQTGRRVEVESLRFEGASELLEKELVAAIETRANFPGERGLFSPARLRSDTRALEALYASKGFRDARAELLPPQFSADGRRVRLVWRIEEGPRYRVGEVRVEPEGAASVLSSPLERLALKAGAAFSERDLQEDAERLREALDRRGYPLARVEPAVAGDPAALRVVHRVDTGPALVVGGVSVHGNLLTREGIIRRELGFGAGDPLSEQRMADAQRSLYELGVFRSVSVEPESLPARPPEAGGAPAPPGPHPIPVRVEVTESPPLTLGVGFGYDSVDRFRGRLDISNRNLFGTRLYAGGVARAGSTERRVQALVRDPRLFGTRLAGLVSAFYEEEERETFDVVRRGARLQVEQRPTPRVTIFYRYSLSEVDLSDVSVTTEDVEPELRLANLGWALAYDSRDDFADPRRGLFGSLDLKWFATGLASEAEFARAFLQLSYYRPLGARLVWASGLRAGRSGPLGKDTAVPISERFFAGGDSSVRGFERDRLGPIDPVTGDPLGGELALIFNQELRFPIWRFLRGVAFYDGGNVFTQSEAFEARGLRHVFGLGLRVDTPIGPLRLDYGHLLDRDEGERPGRLHFSIGHAF